MKILRGHLLLAVGVLIWANGCASIGPPLPPSLELPRAPSDLRASRKGDKVILTWTVPALTTDRQSVRYLGQTRICRTSDLPLKQCESHVGDAAPPADFPAKKSSERKLAATFTDTLPATIQQANPTGFARYGVEVLNTANRSAGISNQVSVPLVPTMPPVSGFSAQPAAEGVLISWHCSPLPVGSSEIKHLFRIYRRSESKSAATKIAEVDATGCVQHPDGGVLSNSFLDQTFEWEHAYLYRGAVVSAVEVAGKPAVEVEGNDTPEVKVFAHDVFPPAVPSGLQAVFSGPGQEAFIDLIWAPVTDSDLDGYNVYRHGDGGVPIKLNADLVKTPAFRDAPIVPGETYFYSVSAVDLRGNESGRSQEASEIVP